MILFFFTFISSSFFQSELDVSFDYLDSALSCQCCVNVRGVCVCVCVCVCVMPALNLWVGLHHSPSAKTIELLYSQYTYIMV